MTDRMVHSVFHNSTHTSSVQSPPTAHVLKGLKDLKTIKYDFLLVVLLLKLSGAHAKFRAAGCDEVNRTIHCSDACVNHEQRCMNQQLMRGKVGTHTLLWSSRVRALIFKESEFLVTSGTKCRKLEACHSHSVMDGG